MVMSSSVSCGVNTVQVEAKSRRHLSNGLPRALAADDPRGTRRLKAQRDGLGNGEDRDEHEVLVHHADARRHCVARPLERDGRPVDEDLPLVGRMHPVQDVHQRGFTRAILSQ